MREVRRRWAGAERRRRAADRQRRFDKNCHGCHSVAADGKAKKKGPNLSKAGTTHDAEWLAEHVRNPKVHTPTSNMPAFASKLSAEEIKNVAEFLATMK